MMDKAIGFFLTRDPTERRPPWLHKYPWLKVHRIFIKGWYITLWGHGDLAQFHTHSNRVVVGYSDTDLALLTVDPLQNRGVVIDIGDGGAGVRNDALGMLPVVYTTSSTVPYISTCEEMILQALGKVTLDEGRLVNFLIYQATVLTYTLWKEIDKLYANRTLRVTNEGETEQISEPVLTFQPVSARNAVEHIHTVTKRAVRLYTDQLDQVILPLSAGQDSRLILAYMQRPERIYARSYPVSWPAHNNIEVRVAKASAAIRGVYDHAILDFKGDFSSSTQPFIEYMGTLVGAGQVYLYAASEMMGREHPGIPVISGIIGDVTAGRPTGFVRKWLTKLPSDIEPFKEACYCYGNEWEAKYFDPCLTFDWRSAHEPLRKSWSQCWQETEGLTQIHRAALVRLRNRCPAIITSTWAAIDIWNSMVAPYLDRDHVVAMLSLEEQSLYDRLAQRQVFARYHSDFWQYAGIPYQELDCRNTLNLDTITGNPQAFWPLLCDGSRPRHRFFDPEGIKKLYVKAIGGCRRSWGLLASLQPIAWAIEKGYVI